MAETLNRVSTILSTTSITDAYQAPNSADANRAVVMSCIVANVDGTNAAAITVDITDSNNAAIAKLAYTISVPAKASVELVANRVVLKRGEKFRATASAANDLEVTVSALEIT